MRIRTGYSFRTAIGHLPQAVDRVKEIGWPAAPICDRTSAFGWRRWRDACVKAGLKPIFGVELGVMPALGEKRPTVDYWQFYAVDDIAAINDLIWKATSNPGRDPGLSYEQAINAEGVIRIAGERVLLDRLEGAQDRVFIALQPSTPKHLFNTGRERGFSFVASPDNVYINPDDREVWRVALGRSAQTQSYPQHIVDDEQWAKAVSWFTTEMDREMALDNRQRLMDQCTATLKEARLIRPERPDTLENMCRAGAVERGIDLSDPVYEARLKRELSVILEKDFEDYFYILSDIVQWARSEMIVGPARGSSCGSLVCYLLGITSVDPIPYGLIFERFIDIDRGGHKMGVWNGFEGIPCA